MALSMSATTATRHVDSGANEESRVSAVSWSAVLGGAFAAASVSVLLLVLGTGLGLSSVSAWPGSGASITTFTVSAAIWLIIVQWLSSALGGYVTGRLRTKWANLHSDEVQFRDTAHGFLSWAVATVLAVAIAASGTTSAISGAGRAAGGAAQAATQALSQSGANGPSYYIDSLFRSDKAVDNDEGAKAEAGRILAKGVRDGSVSDGDKAYLAKMVAARSGLSQDDAKKRVDDVLTQVNEAEAKARAVADETRKATAKASFFLFFSMLIGAFVASAAGAVGGRQRDLI